MTSGCTSPGGVSGGGLSRGGGGLDKVEDVIFSTMDNDNLKQTEEGEGTAFTFDENGARTGSVAYDQWQTIQFPIYCFCAVSSSFTLKIK